MEVFIVNPADTGQMIAIDASVYDPATHTLWADRDMDRGTTGPPPEGGHVPEVQTVEIVSPKDGKSKWTINVDDYKPAEHILWEERNKRKSSADPDDKPTAAKQAPAKRAEA